MIAKVAASLRDLLAYSSISEEIIFLAFEQAMEHNIRLMNKYNGDIGYCLVGSDRGSILSGRLYNRSC